MSKLKKLRHVLGTLMLGIIVSVHSVAAPIAQKNMPKQLSNKQLAMLDLTDLDLLSPQFSENRRSRQKNQPKRILPDDCLSWNAAQIRYRAREYSKAIKKYTQKYKIDHDLVKAVITAESCFKRRAKSSAGARGLMQLIPETAERFGVKDIYNPEQNIRGGTRYLRFLLDRYKGDLNKTIAAYNAGEGKVDHHKGIPPYRETRNYVKNVLNLYNKLKPGKVGKKRIHHVYQPPRLGLKPGRAGWQYNRAHAPHLYKAARNK